MGLTLIRGTTGAGKSTALRRRYHDLVSGGLRGDQILILAAGAGESAAWRAGVDLPAHGGIEAFSFYGFLQRELNLFWAALQGAAPSLRAFVTPQFLHPQVSARLLQGLLEPVALDFAAAVKATPAAIAGQIATQVAAVGAGAGLDPAAMARRLAAGNRPDAGPLFDRVERLLQTHWERCQGAGLLDYGLSLHLFTTVLMQHPPYLAHLTGRYRCLLVDDLDETVPAEQEFLAALAGQLERAVFAINPDGGHAVFQGADPAGALARFAPPSEPGAASTTSPRPDVAVIDLPGSFTCSPALYAFGAALAHRLTGDEAAGLFGPPDVARLATDLRGEMVQAVVERVARALDAGTAPAQIAVITPQPDRVLAAALGRALAARPQPTPLHSLLPPLKLAERPAARALLALAALVNPHWRIPLSPGLLAAAMQVLLPVDPVRAALLADLIHRAGFLPALDAPQADRVGPAAGAAYERLRAWVSAAQGQPWETDSFVQAALQQVLAPGRLDATTIEWLRTGQQLQEWAARFRLPRERLGETAFGAAYQPLLTDATTAPAETPPLQPAGVIVATPFGFLSARLTAQVMIWADVAAGGWCPTEARELANPHLLSPAWPAGERWTDRLASRYRLAAAARTTSALARRCTGQLLLVECPLSPWGLEQEGALAEAAADLVREGGRRP